MCIRDRALHGAGGAVIHLNPTPSGVGEKEYDEDDVEIIKAMKKGAKAILTAKSSRGTKTQDTFSLLGFTAALEDAEKRCK